MAVSKALYGKKILCRVWNREMTEVLARRIVKYGTPYFNVKIGDTKRKFKINYDVEATIKRDGKVYTYDTNFDNTIGAMRFYSYSEHEVIASDEAYTVFEDNAVKMYVAKGGIPMLYLLIAMIMTGAMAFAIILTVPDGLQAQEQRDLLDAELTKAKQDIAIKNQQIQQLQAQVNR